MFDHGRDQSTPMLNPTFPKKIGKIRPAPSLSYPFSRDIIRDRSRKSFLSLRNESTDAFPTFPQKKEKQEIDNDETEWNKNEKRKERRRDISSASVKVGCNWGL